MEPTGNFDRFYGALLGLAYGDALGFPAMFHRTFQFPEKRRHFIWRTNRELMAQRIIRLTLPFTHRLEASTLEPFPTDDSEWLVFSAQTILQAMQAGDGRRPLGREVFLQAWQARILPQASEVLSGFSERAAIENLQRGVLPPASGNDNPQHYDDAGAVRAAAAGLACAGQPAAAAQLAEMDAEVTNAEDGVYAARAMAAAIAHLAGGGKLSGGLAAGREQIPAGSWIARGDTLARACLEAAGDPSDLALLLGTRLINTVYSYGNAAPETIPAAFAIVEGCRGELQTAVLLANAIPKAADSLPGLVGALCGAYRGSQAISAAWQAQLNRLRGLCLPFLAGVSLADTARQLAEAAPAVVEEGRAAG